MSIRHDMAQNSPEWHAIRLGKPTASCFDKIITPAKGELSKSSRAYACELVAETLLGAAVEAPLTNLFWVDWGRQHEAQAVRHYCFTNDVDVETVGFITTDCEKIGASPDRLIVGQHGLVEVKCPSPAVHIGYLLDGPGLAYKCQLQGQLWVAEAVFLDFVSFHPSLPGVLVRVERDEPFIEKMRSALAEFCDLRDAMLATARTAGFFDKHTPEAAV
jgi:hypothetical protein